MRKTLLYLNTFYRFFIKPIKHWHLPKKSKILIYDKANSEMLLPFFEGFSVEILPVRGESLNIPCLIRAFLELKFYKLKIIDAYVDAFVQIVSPEVMFTFVDNTVNFYTLSSRFPNIKFVFVQNGWRGKETFDLLKYNNNTNYCVDYMFVFGTAIGCLYNEYVKGKIIHIGSLINNAVLQTDGVSSRSVVFISQFRKKPNDDKFIINSEGQGLSWEQYHAAEAIVLNFLQKWCARNKKILRIAGISYEQQCPERAFYESLLEGVQWEYVPRSDRYSSYRLVDSAEIVVFIDSTLGYEAFVRGKRVACFCCRGAFVDLKDRGFGWPAILPECGPFWTNEADEAVFQQIIEYLYVVSDKDWEITQKRYTSELMEYDPGNSIFSKILETELIPSPDSFPPSAKAQLTI